jgi:miniconductance mechanosensitive channel
MRIGFQAEQDADGTAQSSFDAVVQWLGEHAIVGQVGGLVVVLLVAYLADKITKRILLATIARLVRRTTFTWDDVLQKHRVFERLAHFAPALTIYFGILFIPDIGESVSNLVRQAALASTVLVGIMSVGAFLNAVHEIYATSRIAAGRPMKGYVQIAKILVYVLGSIVAVATLIGRSPLFFLGGIGAMTAVLLLVFRDTILSFVASLQIASNDMIRVGDWIEMPQFGADGDVVDIALHTVKVQNWDKTITTIPTHRLISDSFKNWRSMSESGGRRIKRALLLDMNSIRFLDDADIERFGNFVLLQDYIAEKKKELEEYNQSVTAGDPSLVANARKLTNIGTFRMYVVQYLRSHPKIHKEMTFLIRQLSPTPSGLPLEIYVFSNDVAWVPYEGIQSDIFDHLLAIVPEFGLRVFQQPTGQDFQAAFSNGDAKGAA